MTSISIQIAEPGTLTSQRTAAPAVTADTLWGRMTTWLRSSWCVINGGHYKVLHTEPDKLALRCVACGHMSPGWEVGALRVARQVPADRSRLRGSRVQRPIAA